MELEKKKYARIEVQQIIDKYVLSYENKLAEQKSRISELLQDNKSMSEQLAAYQYKDKLIAEAVKKSEEYLENSKKDAEKLYALNTEYLKVFRDKWQRYFDYLTDKYPKYEVVKNANKIKAKLDIILSDKIGREVVEELSVMIGKDNDGVFDPKSKISEYIATSGENGFNMEEVLNPGELHLEDICKELGLLDENE